METGKKFVTPARIGGGVAIFAGLILAIVLIAKHNSDSGVTADSKGTGGSGGSGGTDGVTGSTGGCLLYTSVSGGCGRSKEDN